MRTRTSLGLAVTLSCAALVTVVGVARDGVGDTAASSTTPPRGPYVALGDSYTAGPKIPGQNGKPAGCDRSDRNYPALVAAELGLERAEFHDVSCSGATTGDLLAAQDTDDGTNPAQLSAVSASTRLVTIGIGGNDIGFGSLITRCVKVGVRYQLESRIGDSAPDPAPCRERQTSGGTDDVETKIEATSGRVADVLGDIRRRAPEARVYVVGYPTILPARGADCGPEMGLAPGDVTYLRQKEQQLNTMLREAANDAGAGYVDTYGPSDGRDACAQADVRWVEPLIPAAPAAPVHPNERGERGMAQAVLRAVRATG
ncbi:MAG: SGNH/GDSL hydrolase family protein [Streptomyces sp.]|nr:SGNH/GDSL hydrolase family protein [Streptomyces sp.]NUR40741.1 SGNH/GDSL hydrolase family protein [Streptomyces sp.]NUS14625.1 SGNH/GDSL hydrolase family protein [Streptomyces sp.]NUS25993.1 SGNH/GDSL hydrolase family protein [Streptomyces sp.]NUS79809.1 SGNH/GDSL hydrolase family protein [Streptomyces sp.]